MTSIVIPAINLKPQNRPDLLNLLNCLAPDADKYEKIIVCFDGLESNSEFYEFFTEKFPFIHPILNELNPSGFSINANRGLRFCRDELKSGCFLVNQDCILPSYEYMQKIVGEGLATPESIDLNGPDDGLEDDSEKADYLNELNKELSSGARTKIYDKFPFYCPYFSYELLRDVGLLDEDQKNVFSDDSMIIKILLHGKYPIENVDIKIHHRGSYIDASKNNWESGSGTYNAVDLGHGLAQHKLKWSVDNKVDHANIIQWALENHKWSEDMKIQ